MRSSFQSDRALTPEHLLDDYGTDKLHAQPTVHPFYEAPCNPEFPPLADKLSGL